MTFPSRRSMILIALAGAALFAGGVITGRLTKKPVEVITTTKGETQFLYAAHSREQRVDRGRTRTVRVREKKPDGTVLTTTTVDHAADLTLNLDWLTNASANARQETTTASRDLTPRWRLGLGANWQPSHLSATPYSYSLEADRLGLLGPLGLGVRGSYVPDRPRESAVGVAISFTR